MFKNLKKKIGDEGAADLSTLSSPGTLGSSLSSLRRSGSKTSSLSVSRESLQSESFKTILTSPVIDELDQNNSSLQEHVGSLSLLLDAESSEVVPSTENGSNSGRLSENVEDVSKKDVKNTSAELFSAQEDHVDFNAIPETNGNLLDLEEEPVKSSNLFPTASKEKQKQNETEFLRQQLAEKMEEEKILERRLIAQESDRVSFRAELERLKDIANQNRLNEEKLTKANSKISELAEQLENEKLERDSWKISHDQAVMRLKEKTAALQSAQKKTADLETKTTNLNSSFLEIQKTNERLKDENSSLKNTMEILEKQIDKFIFEIQTEKNLKEKTQNETKKLQEENLAEKLKFFELEKRFFQLETNFQEEKTLKESFLEKSKIVSNLEETLKKQENKIIEIQKTNEEKMTEIQKKNEEKIIEIQKTNEEKLAKIQKTNEENFENLKNIHEVELNDLQKTLLKKEETLSAVLEEEQKKDEIISNFEISTKKIEVRLKNLEEELESKEATLAVFRRRSAKDTEIKLRERDKQIASLEKQLTELSERVNVVGVQDHTSSEYTKNVVLKFLSGNGEERLHLIRPVSVLLQLTEAEESWLKEVIAWKQQWLPGPKPELGHLGPSHSNGNGVL